MLRDCFVFSSEYSSYIVKGKLIVPVALTVRMHHAAGYLRLDLPFQSQRVTSQAMTVPEGASEIQRHIIAGEL